MGIPVTSKRLAQALCLRTWLLCRQYGYQGLIGHIVQADGAYTATTNYWGDNWYGAQGIPGYSAEWMREQLAYVAASVGMDPGTTVTYVVYPDPYEPVVDTIRIDAMPWYLAGVSDPSTDGSPDNPHQYVWRNSGSFGFPPTFEYPGLPLYLLAGVAGWLMPGFEQRYFIHGDHQSYWDFHSAWKTALDGDPRTADGMVSGNHYIITMSGWRDGTPALFTQNASVWPSVMSAYGYDALYRMAVQEGDTASAADFADRRDTLTTALQSRRNASGYYRIGDGATADTGKDDVWATVHLVGAGLCTQEEGEATAAAIVADINGIDPDMEVNHGLVRRGYLRMMRPGIWLSGGGHTDYFQNGGYAAFYTRWLLKTLNNYGQQAMAQKIGQQLVREFLRQERFQAASVPWEAFREDPDTNYTTSRYITSTAGIGELDEADPGYFDITIPAGSNYAEVARLDGQPISGADVAAFVAGTSTPASVSATVSVLTYADIPDNQGTQAGAGTRSGAATVGTVLINGTKANKRRGFTWANYLGGYTRVSIPGVLAVDIQVRLYTRLLQPFFTSTPQSATTVPPGFVLDCGGYRGTATLPTIYTTGANSATVAAAVAAGGALVRDSSGAVVAGPSLVGQYLAIPDFSASASPVVGGTTTLTMTKAPGATVTVVEV